MSSCVEFCWWLGRVSRSSSSELHALQHCDGYLLSISASQAAACCTCHASPGGVRCSSLRLEDHSNKLSALGAQALSDNSDKGYMKGMKTLEINPRHPLVERLRELVRPLPRPGRCTEAVARSLHACTENTLGRRLQQLGVLCMPSQGSTRALVRGAAWPHTSLPADSLMPASLRPCATAQVEQDKEALKTMALAQTLFDTALLESGFDIDNPQDFNKRIHRILASNMGLEGSLDASSEVRTPEAGTESWGRV